MKKEIIFLYVMDALRADHLCCYGYRHPTSKNIDRIAKSAVVFKNIYSQSTETKSSSATMYTSTYPSVHNTVADEDRLPEGIITIAESMRGAGFVTAAFNANMRIGTDYGFNRGFDYYFDLFTRPEFDGIAKFPRSDLLTREILTWINRIEANKVFITAWSMDTHMPYFPPEEFIAKFVSDPYDVSLGTIESILRAKKSDDFKHLVSLYDAEILYNDHNIGKMVECLEKKQLWTDTTFIFTSDHGEMILEHGQFMDHGGMPYREVTHVPLIIKSPDLSPGRNSTQGGLIDLMPTILRLAAIEPPQTIQGHDLLDGKSRKYVFSETIWKSGRKADAVFDENWKLIRTDSPLRVLLKKTFLKGNMENRSKKQQLFERQRKNDGISIFLIKKRRLRKLIIDFIGKPPHFDRNIFLWVKWLLIHFCGKIRLELYNRIDDPFEQKNVLIHNREKYHEFVDQLNKFQTRNIAFKKSLNLRQEQKLIDAVVAERLKHLGYID